MSEFAGEFTGCVWTEALSREKKLWIQKYGSKNVRIRVEGASKCFVIPPGAIIGDGDRKSWDARGPHDMGQFFYF